MTEPERHVRFVSPFSSRLQPGALLRLTLKSSLSPYDSPRIHAIRPNFGQSTASTYAAHDDLWWTVLAIGPGRTWMEIISHKHQHRGWVASKEWDRFEQLLLDNEL